jgi:hypothetical protein
MAMPLSSREILERARRHFEEWVPCHHSPDFASVNWFGRTYYFTPTQGAIVRVLWDAYFTNSPEVRQETLLIAASSDSRRLEWVFKGNEAWGSLIISSSHVRGAFRLNDTTAAE